MSSDIIRALCALVATANAIEHTCPLKSRYVIIPAFFSEADQFYDLTMLDSK